MAGGTKFLDVITNLTGAGTAMRGLQQTTAFATALAAAGAPHNLSFADSGGIFTVAMDGVYTINLPDPTVGAGLRYVFIGNGGANDVSVSTTGASTFTGTIVENDATPVVAVAGADNMIFEAAGADGDMIEVISTSTTTWAVRAVTSAIAGITSS